MADSKAHGRWFLDVCGCLWTDSDRLNNRMSMDEWTLYRRHVDHVEDLEHVESRETGPFLFFSPYSADFFLISLPESEGFSRPRP